MTVLKNWGMACPGCGESSRIEIEAKVWVLLTTDGTDADEAVSGSGHEWDDASQAKCQGCDREGVVSDFKVKEPAEVK